MLEAIPGAIQVPDRAEGRAVNVMLGKPFLPAKPVAVVTRSLDDCDD